MCAILGIVGKNIPDKETVVKARDTMTHRGPDDAGLYFAPEEGAALGHRRLSIIDISPAGRQPFTSNDGRYVLTYNGEIYNYKELKDELKHFYDFRTSTDTEVLLAAYAKWKEKCLHKLNGMFAFAVWDRQTKTLFAARDRLGVKPFFYMQHKGLLFFASEIKALLTFGALRIPNERTIFEYLYYGFYDHGEETFFENTKRLLPGHYLVSSEGGITIKKYWDLADIKRPDEMLSEDDVKGKFRELLADSIRLQFRSDVPVGINLSSGLDSNTLLYYSKNITGYDVDTLTVGLPSEEYDERTLVESFLTMSQKNRWHKCRLDPDEVFPLAETMNGIQSEPYGGIPTISWAVLNRRAQDAGLVVLLEGQGVDEILGGYKYYGMELKKDRDGFAAGDAALSSVNYSQDTSSLIDKDVLDDDFVKRHNSAPLSFKEPFSSHLLNAQYRDLMHTKLPRVLRFNDHASMVYGRELRVPYLDHRIVEFCLFLPSKYKIKDGSHKVLIRDIMHEHLPNVVNSRQKKAFGAIQVQWLREHLKKEVMSLLNSDSFRSRKYWNHTMLQKKIDKFYRGEGSNSFFLWQCINLELWFRKFID